MISNAYSGWVGFGQTVLLYENGGIGFDESVQLYENGVVGFPEAAPHGKNGGVGLYYAGLWLGSQDFDNMSEPAGITF